MTKTEKLRHCSGCRQNFYNGNNDIGVSECWHLKDMKLIFRKEVPLTQRPPWKQKARKLPQCYQRGGYVYVGANQES